MFKKIFPPYVSFFLILIFIFHPIKPAIAWWGIADTSLDPASLAEEAMIYAQDVMSYQEQYGNNIKEWAKRAAVNAVKKAAMNAVQKKLMKGAQSKMITDYGKYLYSAPTKKAADQMNAYLNSISGGTASNYEGVGASTNYNQYMKRQAENSYKGINMQPNIRDIVSDPTKPFSTGNMQGIMSLLECGNNPMCANAASQAKYNELVNQNQKIAEAESANGFMPTKDANGNIVSPALSASNQLTLVGQMGVDSIVNAMNNDDSSSDLIGAGESYITNLVDYTMSDGSNGSPSGNDMYAGDLR